MNRAERRREQKFKTKVRVMTHDDMMYEKGLRAGLQEGIRLEAGRTTRILTTAVVAVLHREFGFGTRRIDRMLRHLSWMLETIEQDVTREPRYREWLKKELGLDLDDYTGGRDMDLRERLQKEYDLGVLDDRTGT